MSKIHDSFTPEEKQAVIDEIQKQNGIVPMSEMVKQFIANRLSGSELGLGGKSLTNSETETKKANYDGLSGRKL